MFAENPVRQTTWKIMRNACDVGISQSQIEKITDEWIKQNLSIPLWPKKFHLETDDPIKMLDYLIILDSLNFCFWPDPPESKKWSIAYQNKEYSGYFALSLALKKFFEEHPKKANLSYFIHIPFREFVSILGGGHNLQFLKTRWEIAKRVSKYLIKNYQSAEIFIRSAKNKLSILVPKIAAELYSFNDVAYLMEGSGSKKIYFWKRAQILAVDIWAGMYSNEIGHFEDLDYPTAFADYKLPQILHHWKILEYSPDLETKIKNKNIIAGMEAAEIRSATIWAVEYLRAELARRGKEMRAFEIDWLLWDKSQNTEMPIPHHLTKTIFY